MKIAIFDATSQKTSGSHAQALIVIHKYLKARHPGMDCRDPVAMDGNIKLRKPDKIVDARQRIFKPRKQMHALGEILYIQ